MSAPGAVVLRVAGHRVADGTWVFDPRNSPFGRTLSDRARAQLPPATELEEWDPDPEWTAWASTASPDAVEPRPVWDPFDHLEDGEQFDSEGEPLGRGNLLPLEWIEVSPEEERFLREDANLRRAAVPLYDLTSEVITDEFRHPFSTLTCETCGDQSAIRLDHCGVPLCLPCWRKASRRAFREVARTLAVFVKLAEPRFPLPESCDAPGHVHDDRWPDLRGTALRLRDLAVRPVVRFVTLTIRNGPSLEERARTLLDAYGRLVARRFWRSRVLATIAKLEVTYSPNSGGGWHVHLHLASVGRYIPDRPSGPLEEPRLVPRARALKRPPPLSQLPPFYRLRASEYAPTYLADWEPESNLRDEWVRATRGEGSVVDIRTADVRDGQGGFAAELSKYIAKPVAASADGSRLELKDWPNEARVDLARFLRGGTRIRWYCPEHRTASRRGCPPGCEKGEYRRESVGARRLRYYGLLRAVHAELRESSLAERDDEHCSKCRVGKLRSPWEIRRLLEGGWSLPAGAVPPCQLPSIQAHKSRARRWCARTFDGSPRWSGQSAEGTEGPPIGGADPEDLFGGGDTRADRARREREP
jgi:hypothetical protein